MLQKSQGTPPFFKDPEPWPAPVDGNEMALGIRAKVSQHVVLPAGGAVAVTLWVLHTYLLEASTVSPILTFQSPSFRSGKTTAQRVTNKLVRRPLLVSNVSSAALYRAIEQYAPTLFIDEAETFLR